MTKRRYSIPSTSALVAFESAARHCNFSRAAEELHTSQSAISRHIADLESRLGAQLFAREKKRLFLNPEGEQFYKAVVSGLENLQSGARAVADSAAGEQLTIACTHAISHLFLMPRFEALQQALGDEVQIRIMTYEYDALKISLDPRIDLHFNYDRLQPRSSDRAMVCQEAVQPVCAPLFAQENTITLSKPVLEWGQLPYLRLSDRNLGWATWQDWFDANGISDLSMHYTRFDNYVYLLEAATAGRGLALGWRGLIERHLDDGTLVALRDDYTVFKRALYAELTTRGQARAVARCCLALFAA